MIRLILIASLLFLCCLAPPVAAQPSAPVDTTSWTGFDDSSPRPYVIKDGGDEPPPAGYVRRKRIRKNLVTGGAITAGTLWVASIVGAAAGAATGTEGTAVLTIPVVGPVIGFWTIKKKRAPNDIDAGAYGGIAYVALLGLDAAGQATGVALLIAGLAAKKSEFVRSNLAEIEVLPILGPGRTGLTLRGHF